LFSEILTIFDKIFCSLTPILFKQMMLEVIETQVSTLAKTEFDILHVKYAAFDSNLIYSTKDFSNYFHRDRKFKSYYFGIKIFIYSKIRKLVSRENGFNSVGG